MPEVHLPVRDIDDVIGQIQVNGYHGWLLVLCGMGFCVDAMEVLALSFINPCAGAEFNLSDAQIASITSVVFVGELLGSMFWGPFADAYGRWNAYMYSVCFLVIGSWASGFSPSYSWLLFLRFLVGIGVGGNTVPFDIYAEFLPPEARGTRLTYTEFFWTAGEFYVLLAAFLFLPKYGWRGLIFATAVPVTIGAVSCYFILPESPRWLVSQGRFKEAEKIIEECALLSPTKPTPYTFDDPKAREKARERARAKAKKNKDKDKDKDKKPIDIETTNNINTSNGAIAIDTCDTEASARTTSLSEAFEQTYDSLKEIMFSPQMRATTLKIGTVWLCFGFGYYGVILLVTHLYSNQSSDNSKNQAECSFEYGDIAVNTSSEVAGIIVSLLTIDHFGRRETQMWNYGAGAVALLIMGVIPLNRTTIAILGYIMRMCAMAASQTTWVMTPELYPTRVRATAHSLVNCMARFGALLSPFLVVSNLNLPFIVVVLGLVNVVAAVAVWSLKETNGQAMDYEENEENEDEVDGTSNPMANSGGLELPDRSININISKSVSL